MRKRSWSVFDADRKLFCFGDDVTSLALHSTSTGMLPAARSGESRCVQRSAVASTNLRWYGDRIPALKPSKRAVLFLIFIRMGAPYCKRSV